jgi:lycopene cyclase domain-containing protein
MTLTYLEFLAVFLVVPLSVLAGATLRRPNPCRPRRSVRAAGIAAIVALALAYTIPWDNYLIERGVWWYGEGVVAGRVLAMPVGEYLFVVLQSVLVGVWTVERDGPVDASVGHTWRDRLAGATAGSLVGCLGVAFLLGPQPLFYMGAILAWGGPVLALQWGVGWRYLFAVRRRVAGLVAVPVLYLSTVDRLAIGWGLWTISPEYSTGLSVLGLPTEEGAFFLVTTLFVVQGLVLLKWVIARWG